MWVPLLLSSRPQLLVACTDKWLLVINDTTNLSEGLLVINDTTDLSEGLPIINDMTNLNEGLLVINNTSDCQQCAISY